MMNQKSLKGIFQPLAMAPAAQTQSAPLAPQITQRLVPLVDEFASRLFGELDYVQEGKNCEKFEQLYGSMPKVGTDEWAPQV